MADRADVRMRALVDLRTRHQGLVRQGNTFSTTEAHAKLLEQDSLAQRIVERYVAEPVGPTETKPAGPTYRKRKSGGGWWDILLGSEVIEKAHGEQAADERLDELNG